MLSSKITRISLGISLTILFIMWFVFFLDYAFDLEWYRYGLYPLKLTGLIGIITSPFLHGTADFSHILNNSLPAFALTWMLFYHYRTIATKSFLFIYFFTGIMMWFFARESYHIGMSGVIYGLTSFLVLSGFLRKNMKVAAISLAVIFYYGSMVWGIFPSKVGVSWEAHAIGLLSGVLIAIYYRKSGPQPDKMIYEIEEELGFESEEEYWKAGYQPKPKEPKPENTVIYRYTILPKKEDPKK